MKKYILIPALLLCAWATKAQVSVCLGEQVCLTLSNVRGNIQWQRSTDLVNWLILGGETNDTLCFNAIQSAWYRAEISEGSCADFYSDTTQVIANPTVVAHAGPDKGYCSGGSSPIGDSPAATGGILPYTFSWSPSTGLSNAAISNPTTTAVLSTTYVLTVTDSAGCIGRDTMQLTVYPSPVVNAGADVSIPCSLNAVIGGAPTASGGTSPYTYAWSPNNQLSSTTVSNPTADPYDTTTYTVLVTDANGCSASDSMTVNITGGGPGPGSTTYSYTGGVQYFVVPSCVDSVTLEVWGAQGGGSQCCSGTDDDGGLGGYAYGKLGVVAGETLYVYVGQKPPITNGFQSGGFNGGGNSGQYGGAGGGASDVRRNGQGLMNRVIVGGGGGGGNCGCPNHGTGGPGGGLNGGNGINLSGGFTPAGGGSQTSGGTGGSSPGYPGTSGQGGGSGGYHEAGGGGGWYGGGSAYAAGGGGGSAYIGGVSNGTTTPGVWTGDGMVTISWQ